MVCHLFTVSSALCYYISFAGGFIIACHSACSVACWLWQCNARGATSSPTLSAAVRPPRHCSDCFSCPEVRSRDTITPWTPLASDSGTDYLQAVVPRLPVSQRHSTCLPRRQHQPCNWRHHEAKSPFQLINGGRCSSDSLQHDRGSRFPGCCCPCMEQFTIVCYVIVVTVDF